MAGHPIFRDINRDDLEAVKQHVLADPTVLEERGLLMQMTPLTHAIHFLKPIIAHWLIKHRGQHDLSSCSSRGSTALHWACYKGLLSVGQALVATGA